jgi:hypothetical protein
MAVAQPLKHPVKVGQLVRRRLKELKRTPRELAEVLQVTERYIADLVAGRRQPPPPTRTEVYAKMTRFLRLHRNDLPICAQAEHERASRRRRLPHADVRAMLLGLCEPAKARLLSRRFADRRHAALAYLVVERLLEVARGFARRQLEDEVGMRVTASRDGTSYIAVRMRLLEFLDAAPDSLTPADCADFIEPRIANWDIDLESGAMRIVLRSQETAPRQKRVLGV